MDLTWGKPGSGMPTIRLLLLVYYGAAKVLSFEQYIYIFFSFPLRSLLGA